MVKPEAIDMGCYSFVFLFVNWFLLASNDQVHAAGAFDVDFKTDVAARSRATPGSPVFVRCQSNFAGVTGAR